MSFNRPSNRHSGRFSILTFNIWHGLAERGVFRFREFEEANRRQARWQLALSEIQRLRPDVVCLQELNPLSQKLSELVTALDGVATGCVDQGGIRLFSQGLPQNLVTGLGVLLREAARPVKGREWSIPRNVQLSGAPFISGESFSFHFNEIRRAQLEMIETTLLGRVLIVNTHLHHGFERFAALCELVESYVSEGRISQETAEQLGLAMDQSRDRRLHEVDRLLEAVTQAERHCDGIVLAGDLNSPPDGQAVRSLFQAGFRDLAELAIQPDIGPTWDPVTNIENHKLQETFRFPLPTMGNPELQRLYRDFDRLPRRIDYILGRGSPVSERAARASRIGMTNGSSVAPSDHYGLLVEWN